MRIKNHKSLLPVFMVMLAMTIDSGFMRNFLFAASPEVSRVILVDKAKNEVLVANPGDGKPFKMGDRLSVRAEGRVVVLRVAYPMSTLSKCVIEKGRELADKISKGMPVYRGIAPADKGEGEGQPGKYKIGDRGPAGGWIFYDKGSLSDGWRYLEASPEDLGSVEWGCRGMAIPGAGGRAVGDGKRNTQAILKSCGEPGIAARLCAGYRGGGKSDWFLPSRDELNLVYVNLKKNGISSFPDIDYWSSTQGGAGIACYQSFVLGIQFESFKLTGRGQVRAVRAF